MSIPATLRLPVDPSLEHLRKQAKRLCRERPSLTLQQAQHQLAKAYGCADWEELTAVVVSMADGRDRLTGDSSRQSALADATNRHDLDTVQRILASGDFTRHDLNRALARAVLRFRERHAIAELLMAHGADPDGQYGSAYGPLALVTGECLDPDGMQFLIDQGADLAFPPLTTKYGHVCMFSSVLGAYGRGATAAKHACIEILRRIQAPLPAVVSPALLALHSGDADGLARALDADGELARRTIPDLPYGNTVLAGATMLHAAMEFEEPACLRLLLERGADPNAQAALQDGVGGQTPVFHAIAFGWEVATAWVGKLEMLETLLGLAGSRLDLGIRARLRRSDGAITGPAMTALALAASTSPAAGSPAARVLELLRTASASRS